MKVLRITSQLIIFLALSSAAFAGTLVRFTIFAGVSVPLSELDVELYDQDKPVTVSNFLHLVQSGAYANSFFHRCEPNFVLQGGGFEIINPPSTNVIAPPYTNQFVPCPNFGPITNEFSVGKFYSNTNGTIAMAKTSDPNSATSQFFFNLTNNSSTLDQTNNAGGFTVFGHVVHNVGLLSGFNSLNYGTGLFDLVLNYGTNTPLTATFQQLPANLEGFNPPPLSQLFYFNASLLSLHASLNPANGARQLSWLVVPGVTNNLEFSTNMPPSWQLLASVTNATAVPVTVTDSTPNVTNRFYRLHILF